MDKFFNDKSFFGIPLFNNGTVLRVGVD